MATERRVSKTEKTPKPKKAAPAGGVQLVSPDTLTLRPKKNRTSALDPVIKALLESPTKAYVFQLEAGKNPVVQRSMLYPRLAACLKRLDASGKKRGTVSILEDGNLSIQLVDRE